MAYKDGYRLWDDEYERAHWTPEEIKASNIRIAIIGEIIQAKQTGATQDEAEVQCFIRHPDFADKQLNDAITIGDIEEAQRLQRNIETAKTLSYWGSLIDNAEKIAENGKNIDVIIGLINKALDILKSATANKAITT